MLVHLTSVAHFYNSRLIFKDVTLAFGTGEVSLLTGANGAGKSTLLKIIAGLVKPSNGTVTLKDDLTIGMVGHKSFLYPAMTALENLRFWAEMHGRNFSEKKLGAALERVNLAPFCDEKAGTFSRGMAQRLSLARVFLLSPDLLLLDEPGTGLDTQSSDTLYGEIAEAKKRGASVVWISHAIAADTARADKVIHISDRLVTVSTPEGKAVPGDCGMGVGQ